MGIFNIISDKNLKHPTPESCTVVSRCTQTDVCDLPAKKTVPHTGCNTTPKFVRDKTNQHAPTLISKGISPHCVFIDKPTMNNWEQESSPPVTPDLDIPSYFTENFQQKRDYQDALPVKVQWRNQSQRTPSPHISAEVPQWGVIQKSDIASV